MAKLPSSVTLSVNISPVQLRDLSISNKIQKIAKETSFYLNRLTIESTESALPEDLSRARTILEALKGNGCKLALDDFGTGYSSLTHLRSLPFDEIKVDCSFVSSMEESRDSRKIIAAVVGLGQSLGLITVARSEERRVGKE